MWPTFPLEPPPLHLQHQHSLSARQKFKRLHTKNNKGRKHSKHMVLIYWHFPEGDREAKTATRRCLLCRFESTAMQSFKCDTGGRNGLSLLQREKEERSGMGRQKG